MTFTHCDYFTYLSDVRTNNHRRCKGKVITAAK